ncbi:MAG: D-cysteine desulfhydrase family protein [Bacillota bacterium]|nr:D-cysteine desulfhydrase family protein [Bacillota bacterium]
MEKFNMANLPTRIEKLKNIYNEVEIYIKRDDQTGFELSGNKIRKLDYTLYEAYRNGCDAVITCGGIQSNHARATAIAAVKLNMKPYLVLKSDKNDDYSGNYFLDQMIGADIKHISFDDYKNRRAEIMENLKNNLEKKGKKAYVIPEGSSNGLGNFGYINAYREILEQEKELNIKFDYIAAAMGSGSTHAGLFLGAEIYESSTKIIGYNIYNPKVDGQEMIYDLVMDSKKYIEIPKIYKKDIYINSDYVGRGYALSNKEEIDFIKKFAVEEGILLDTVYTGKAMYGLIQDIKKDKYKKGTKILFIHTGGVFGNFSKQNLFDL